VRRVGLLGGIAAVVAAGAAVGLAVERYAVGRTRLRPDPLAAEPLGELVGTERTVLVAGGVPLCVLESGPGDGVPLGARAALPAGGGPRGVVADGRAEDGLAVVFVHGYVLDRRCWYFQWRDLRDLGRLICYDQRGHGRSGRGARELATIDQLGADLLTVLDGVAPTSPVVLVGHSMGAMAIMALAERRPDVFSRRVAGVGLISTSAGNLREVTLGLPAIVTRAFRSVTPVAVKVVERRTDLVERGRRVGSDVAFLLTKWYSFGSGVSPSLVAFVERMIAGVRVDVMTEFLPTLLEHDRTAALEPLLGVPVLILTGDRDKQTPLAHSRAIAAALPAAELVVVPDAGHLVMLERPDEVNAALRQLVRRAARPATTDSATGPITGRRRRPRSGSPAADPAADSRRA